VLGSALARIAEAAVSLFQVTKEAPLRAAAGGELALAQANLRAIETLESVRVLLVALLDVHMEVAIRRLREARPRASVDTATFAVGFLDLVGFTTLSSRVATRELAAVVERFEEAAYDVAAARDGRVVKFIGDEVMFVTRDAAAACDIALALIERFAGDTSVTPRGGLARGEVLIRGGDYYGPIVNLAARITELAVPSEVLVTPEVAAQCEAPGLRFEPAGKRMLKGFADPVTLLGLSRANV
jgi:adenylate cyclase